jgi:hypothetical protein
VRGEGREGYHAIHPLTLPVLPWPPAGRYVSGDQNLREGPPPRWGGAPDSAWSAFDTSPIGKGPGSGGLSVPQRRCGALMLSYIYITNKEQASTTKQQNKNKTQGAPSPTEVQGNATPGPLRTNAVSSILVLCDGATPNFVTPRCDYLHGP